MNNNLANLGKMICGQLILSNNKFSLVCEFCLRDFFTLGLEGFVAHINEHLPESSINIKNEDSIDLAEPYDRSNAGKIGTVVEEEYKEEPSGMDRNGVLETKNFDDMKLKAELLRGIYEYGFERPSSIQKRIIMPCILGRDVFAQAHFGTGKTVAFSIAILQRIDTSIRECQALILVPTYELASQIEKIITDLGVYMDACVGVHIHKDIRKFKRGTHVVVDTPDRVKEMIDRKLLSTRLIKMFVLDEADEMSRGFNEQIYRVFQQLNTNVQAIFLSDSILMKTDVLEMSTKFMRNPVRILNKESPHLEGIKHFYVDVDKDEWKCATLLDFFGALSTFKTVIVCNTTRKVNQLTEHMTKGGFSVLAMHGEMVRAERYLIMTRFGTASFRVLITTDLLARVIDMQKVSLVINYDFPTKCKDYIRRIGCTGHFGRKNVVINFITMNDKRNLLDIEKFYNSRILEMPVDIADRI